MINTEATKSSKVRLEKHQQALDQVDMDNDFLMQRTAPTIADFLQHQASHFYCIQATLDIGTTNVEYTIERNGLIVQVAPTDGAVHILAPQALW